MCNTKTEHQLTTIKTPNHEKKSKQTRDQRYENKSKRERISKQPMKKEHQRTSSQKNLQLP